MAQSGDLILFIIIFFPLIYGLISLYHGIKSKYNPNYKFPNNIVKNSDMAIVIGVIGLIIQLIIIYGWFSFKSSRRRSIKI